MRRALSPLDGALRVRLDEDAWSGLAGDTAPRSVLRPLDGAGARPAARSYDAGLREAATLALGPAAIHLDLAVGRGDRGLLAALGTDGWSAAGAVRTVATPDGGAARPVPGVEVSGFPAGRLVEEVLRLLPPDGVVVPLAPEEPTEVSLPRGLAIPLTRALQVGDTRLAATIARTAGLDAVPDLLEAAAERVRASATATIAVAGSSDVQVHTWLQCRLGWLDVSLHRDTVTTRLVDRHRIRLALTHAVAGAFDAITVAGAR